MRENEKEGKRKKKESEVCGIMAMSRALCPFRLGL
jgi:hypothetical protein